MTISPSRVAVVTGASSGIGRACALGLLKDGWTVVLAGRREAALQQAIADAGGDGARAHPMTADLTQEEDVKALFNAVHTQFGRLDLLFNNAGMSLPYSKPGDLSGDDWRRVVDINLNGAFYCLSHAFRLMQTQTPQGGRIINNGSISSQVPRPGSIAYAATKHAVRGMTKAASLDGREHGIAVGQIDIGNVTSDMTLEMTQGVRQADGSMKPEPCMDMQAVVDTFMAMVRLPPSANVLFTTVMAAHMPFVGRG